MASTIQQFTYRIVAPKNTDDPFRPFNVIVEVTLRDYSTHSNDDWPILSPHLMSEGEIDGYIDAMKKDLDHVGKLAKRALARANSRTRTVVQERREQCGRLRES